jgi:hypothetical protein
MRPFPFHTVALTVALLPASLGGQTPLPIGSTTQGTLAEGEARFVYAAKEAGFLTVIVRAQAGEDLALAILDEEGQPLADGLTDSDLGGDVGAEQLVVVLPSAGSVQIRVRSFMDDDATFHIGGSFLASKLVASPPDPDGRPSRATELSVGATQESSLDSGAGDLVDWYRIKVEKAGVLTVLTRTDEEGDLRLEVYAEGAYEEPEDSSDQDMDGVMGNESLTIDVDAGEVVLIRVLGGLMLQDSVRYRITSGLISG